MTDINKNPEKPQQENQSTVNVVDKKTPATHDEIEKDLNAKILKITLSIKEQYPELSKYIEEMPVTIPDEKNPEISLKNLQTYYDSLNSILNKYILEHSESVIKK